MKPTSSPAALNEAPPATTVAPTAIKTVPVKRSRRSGRPRIRHADHAVPAINTA
jgi:hypothetical protein